MSQSRQLAAIMFTDIVGYTALMGRGYGGGKPIADNQREITRRLNSF